jgi:hypothetical protein
LSTNARPRRRDAHARNRARAGARAQTTQRTSSLSDAIETNAWPLTLLHPSHHSRNAVGRL